MLWTRHKEKKKISLQIPNLIVTQKKKRKERKKCVKHIMEEFSLIL
jgi:hypothetical protein